MRREREERREGWSGRRERRVGRGAEKRVCVALRTTCIEVRKLIPYL